MVAKSVQEHQYLIIAVGLFHKHADDVGFIGHLLQQQCATDRPVHVKGTGTNGATHTSTVNTNVPVSLSPS